MSNTTELKKDGDPTFWTTKEAADDLRVSTQTIRAAAKDNKIPFARVGRDYRFMPADVRAFGKSLLEDA
jgi:excisionase family DNA binding protein